MNANEAVSNSHEKAKQYLQAHNLNSNKTQLNSNTATNSVLSLKHTRYTKELSFHCTNGHFLRYTRSIVYSEF